MDLVKALASIDAHTQALLTHSATMEKFMLVAANGTTGVASTGEAPKRGRPTAAEAAAKLAATTPVVVTPAVAATVVAPVAATVVTLPVTAAVATAADEKLTHQSLKDAFTNYARAHGRDKLVALLGEFGAVEFGKVKVDDLPLFRDRLMGKPQTPVDPNDVGNLLGL